MQTAQYYNKSKYKWHYKTRKQSRERKLLQRLTKNYRKFKANAKKLYQQLICG